MKRKVSLFLFHRWNPFGLLVVFSWLFLGGIDNKLEVASLLSAIREGHCLRISVLSSLCLPVYEPIMAHTWPFKPSLPWSVQSICLDCQSHAWEMQRLSIVEIVRGRGLRGKRDVCCLVLKVGSFLLHLGVLPTPLTFSTSNFHLCFTY